MRFSATLTILLSFLLTLGSSRAQEAPRSEYQVKAAFIFNFAKFVTWPSAAFADAKAPLVIGIFGDNPFRADLEQAVQGKTLNNRPVRVQECRSLEEARKCHILF